MSEPCTVTCECCRLPVDECRVDQVESDALDACRHTHSPDWSTVCRMCFVDVTNPPQAFARCTCAACCHPSSSSVVTLCSACAPDIESRLRDVGTPYPCILTLIELMPTHYPALSFVNVTRLNQKMIEIFLFMYDRSKKTHKKGRERNV
jgi:hypothetical protein